MTTICKLYDSERVVVVVTVVWGGGVNVARRITQRTKAVIVIKMTSDNKNIKHKILCRSHQDNFNNFTFNFLQTQSRSGFSTSLVDVRARTHVSLSLSLSLSLCVCVIIISDTYSTIIRDINFVKYLLINISVLSYTLLSRYIYGDLIKQFLL